MPLALPQLLRSSERRRRIGWRRASCKRCTYAWRSMLHRQPDAHPLHASHLGGMVDYEQAKQSLRMSIEAFDQDAKNLSVRFQPRAGQGSLTLVRR